MQTLSGFSENSKIVLRLKIKVKLIRKKKLFKINHKKVRCKICIIGWLSFNKSVKEW